MADGLLGGFSDFLLGGGKYADSNAINPQYGVPESDVRQAGINTLANVSALLLAAGQPMTGAQRGQLLAQIGPAFGGMTTDIYKASQSRLMLAQQQKAQQEIQEENTLRDLMKDPEAFKAKTGIDLPQGLGVKAVADLLRTTQLDKLDTLQNRINRLKVQEAERSQAQRPAVLEMLKNDPYFADKPGYAELVANNPALQDDYIKQRFGTRKQFQIEQIQDPQDPNKKITVQRDLSTGEIKPITPGGVNIMPGESAEAKTLGEATAQSQIALVSGASKAPMNISRYNLLERLLDQAETGKWSEFKGNIISGAKSLGIPESAIAALGGDPNQPAYQQGARALINSLVLQNIGAKSDGGGMPANSFSNADLQFMQNTFPQLSNEPWGNKIMLEVARRVEKRTQEKNQEWVNYQRRERAAGRVPTFRAFEDNYIERVQDNDLFADLEKQVSERLGQKQGGSNAPAPGRARVISVE